MILAAQKKHLPLINMGSGVNWFILFLRDIFLDVSFLEKQCQALFCWSFRARNGFALFAATSYSTGSKLLPVLVRSFSSNLGNGAARVEDGKGYHVTMIARNPHVLD